MGHRTPSRATTVGLIASMLAACFVPGAALSQDESFFRSAPDHRRVCLTRFDPFMRRTRREKKRRHEEKRRGPEPGEQAARRGAAADVRGRVLLQASYSLSGTGGEAMRWSPPEDSFYRELARDEGERPPLAESDAGSDLESYLEELRNRSPYRVSIETEERPGYLPDLEYRPLLDPSPRPRSAKQQAIVDLVEKEAFRQIRRLLKKHLRRQFKSDLAMTHTFYRSRLTEINQVGRNPDEFDPFNVDQYHNETREDVLRRAGLYGEKELTLFEWGPLQIDDRGSVSFDVRSFFGLEADDPKGLLSGPRVAKGGKPSEAPALISGKYYSVKTKVRVNFDPFRAMRRNDVQDTVTSYGAVVEIDFLSDILKRKLFTTEFEADLRRDGRWGVFFNLVFRGRR